MHGSTVFAKHRHLAQSRLIIMPVLAAASQTFVRGMAQTPDSDMHSDFQPQVKSTPAASAVEQIQQDIKDHKVFVYMKVLKDCCHAALGCIDSCTSNVHAAESHKSDICCEIRETQRRPCVDSAIWSARFLMHMVCVQFLLLLLVARGAAYPCKVSGVEACIICKCLGITLHHSVIYSTYSTAYRWYAYR